MSEQKNTTPEELATDNTPVNEGGGGGSSSDGDSGKPKSAMGFKKKK